MRRPKCLLFCTVLLLTLSSCVDGRRYETTIVRKWPAAGIRNIEVREIDGAIRVDAGMADEVSLTAHVRSRGTAPDKSKENEGFFISKLEGDTLRLGREARRSIVVSIPFFQRRHPNVDYELRVPPTTQLSLRTVNGQITTIGVNGESTFTTVNGGIDVDTQGNGEVTAKSVNGSVKATFRRDFQGARLKTINGSVEAVLPSSASFACDLSQVNGDFEATFPLSIHSNPGSRRVSGEVNGGRFPLRIVTVNGDIGLTNSGIPPAPPVPATGIGARPPAPPEIPRPAPAPPQPPAGMPSQRSSTATHMYLTVVIG
jgi:hypothetical protein